MKKNRNAFFAENNSSYGVYNQMMPNPMAANVPYQSATQNSSFYAGPYPNNNLGMNSMDDFSERLAKVERQINRLDHRISKLEASNTISTDDYDSNTNNMYIL